VGGEEKRGEKMEEGGCWRGWEVRGGSKTNKYAKSNYRTETNGTDWQNVGTREKRPKRKEMGATVGEG
jgi:hypothetical protein